jgi:hypothetical protein
MRPKRRWKELSLVKQMSLVNHNQMQADLLAASGKKSEKSKRCQS